MSLQPVPVDPQNLLPARVTPAELKTQAEEVRELMKAVLVKDTDYGQIRGTQKPTLYKSGAEWLLKWARFGHRLDRVDIERDDDGKPYGVSYRCTIHLLDDPSAVVATCDGYAGYDEPDREAHISKYGKMVPRAPWNTIIKMAQKRAFVGATLQATATSGLFTQDLEDLSPAEHVDGWWKENGWVDQAEHDAYRDTVTAILQKATPAEQAAFKTARQQEGVPAFSYPHTRVQADWVSSHLFDYVKKPEAAAASSADLTEAQKLALYVNDRLPDYDDDARHDLYSAAVGRRVRSGNELDEGDRGMVRDAVEDIVAQRLDLFYDEQGNPLLVANEAAG